MENEKIQQFIGLGNALFPQTSKIKTDIVYHYTYIWEYLEVEIKDIDFYNLLNMNGSDDFIETSAKHILMWLAYDKLKERFNNKITTSFILSRYVYFDKGKEYLFLRNDIWEEMNNILFNSPMIDNGLIVNKVRVKTM